MWYQLLLCYTGMDSSQAQFVGAPCGFHGSYTFYKALKFFFNEKISVLKIGEFFFFKISEKFPVGIGEIQLLWNEKNTNQLLASVRLYFKPRDTPGGPVGGDYRFGNDEVLAMSEKLILTVEELVKRLMPQNEVSWEFGQPMKCYHGLPCDGEINADSSPQLCKAFSESCLKRINFDDVDEEIRKCGAEPDKFLAPVLILTYMQYCRYRAAMKRLEHLPDAWLKNSLIMALGGGMTGLRDGVRVMFVQEVFRYRDLHELQFHLPHLSPKLKGRRRKVKLKKEESDNNSNASDCNSSSGSSTAPQIKSQNILNGNQTLKRKDSGAKHIPGIAERIFLKKIYKFMANRNSPIGRLPSLGFKQVDLYLFYKTAKAMGGYKQICSARKWSALYLTMGGQPKNTSAATATRRQYEKLILPYEKHVRKRKKAKAKSVNWQEGSQTDPAMDPQQGVKPLSNGHLLAQSNRKRSKPNDEVEVTEQNDVLLQSQKSSHADCDIPAKCVKMLAQENEENVREVNNELPDLMQASAPSSSSTEVKPAPSPLTNENSEMDSTLPVQLSAECKETGSALDPMAGVSAETSRPPSAHLDTLTETKPLPITQANSNCSVMDTLSSVCHTSLVTDTKPLSETDSTGHVGKKPHLNTFLDKESKTCSPVNSPEHKVNKMDDLFSGQRTKFSPVVAPAEAPGMLQDTISLHIPFSEQKPSFALQNADSMRPRTDSPRLSSNIGDSSLFGLHPHHLSYGFRGHEHSQKQQPHSHKGAPSPLISYVSGFNVHHSLPEMFSPSSLLQSSNLVYSHSLATAAASHSLYTAAASHSLSTAAASHSLSTAAASHSLSTAAASHGMTTSAVSHGLTTAAANHGMATAMAPMSKTYSDGMSTKKREPPVQNFDHHRSVARLSGSITPPPAHSNYVKYPMPPDPPVPPLTLSSRSHKEMRNDPYDFYPHAPHTLNGVRSQPHRTPSLRARKEGHADQAVTTTSSEFSCTVVNGVSPSPTNGRKLTASSTTYGAHFPDSAINGHRSKSELATHSRGAGYSTQGGGCSSNYYAAGSNACSGSNLLDSFNSRSSQGKSRHSGRAASYHGSVSSSTHSSGGDGRTGTRSSDANSQRMAEAASVQLQEQQASVLQSRLFGSQFTALPRPPVLGETAPTFIPPNPDLPVHSAYLQAMAQDYRSASAVPAQPAAVPLDMYSYSLQVQYMEEYMRQAALSSMGGAYHPYMMSSLPGAPTHLSAADPRQK